MPYIVEKDTDACSESNPWAVKKESDGTVMGCHSSKEDARAQQDALYANETDAAVQGATLEAAHLRRFVTEPVNVSSMPTPEIVDQEGVTVTGTSVPDGVSLWTVQNVPLACIGMEFPASTGPVTFDFGDLESAVQASLDPMIARPRVKLGHTDPRYNDFPCPHCKEWIKFNANDHYVFDGEPNFGFIQGLRLENAGAWIYADLVDVPEWLARVMPVAYPSRSIEGWFGWTGQNDKEYKFVITDLALLGIAFPGVMNLADLPSLYGATMPTMVEFAEVV